MDIRILEAELAKLDGPSRFLDSALLNEFFRGERHEKKPKYTASMDRAKELVEQFFPDSACAVTWTAEGYQAQIEGYPPAFSRLNLATALCMAAVKARAQGEPK
jgi:hypothetical protein